MQRESTVVKTVRKVIRIKYANYAIIVISIKLKTVNLWTTLLSHFCFITAHNSKQQKIGIVYSNLFSPSSPI